MATCRLAGVERPGPLGGFLRLLRWRLLHGRHLTIECGRCPTRRTSDPNGDARQRRIWPSRSSHWSWRQLRQSSGFVSAIGKGSYSRPASRSPDLCSTPSMALGSGASRSIHDFANPRCAVDRFLCVLAGAFLYLRMGVSLYTGELPMRGGSISRWEKPAVYWVFIAFGIALGTFLMFMLR
jgi:hypothetical protein